MKAVTVSTTTYTGMVRLMCTLRNSVARILFTSFLLRADRLLVELAVRKKERNKPELYIFCKIFQNKPIFFHFWRKVPIHDHGSERLGGLKKNFGNSFSSLREGEQNPQVWRGRGGGYHKKFLAFLENKFLKFAAFGGKFYLVGNQWYINFLPGM